RQGGGRVVARAPRRGGRSLLPPRPGAACAEGRNAARAATARDARGRPPGALAGPAAGLARAHGAALSARLAVPRALPVGAAPPVALRLRRRGGGAHAARAGVRLPGGPQTPPIGAPPVPP